MKFKFLNSNLSKRVLILGSSGIISLNLQNCLTKEKVPFKVLGRSKVNLTLDKTIYKLKKIISKKDCVIFISAEAPVKNLKMLFNNIVMSLNFCSKVSHNSLNHLIYISSDAVYKDIKKPMTEKSLAEPNSLHGMMHKIRENIFKKTFKKKLLILRPTLIYGLEDTHNGYGPNQFLKKVKHKKVIKLFGKGEERRDHVFIDDVTKIIFECIKKKGVGTLNVASGKVVSFSNIVKIIKNVLGKKIKTKNLKRNGPMPHGGYRAFNINLLKKNFKKIKISSIQKGIEKYYLKNINNDNEK